QRKSSRAKEKKQRRLEERAAMAAVCAKVEAANKLRDPLEAFPVFKKYDRNGFGVNPVSSGFSGVNPVGFGVKSLSFGVFWGVISQFWGEISSFWGFGVQSLSFGVNPVSFGVKSLSFGVNPVGFGCFGVNPVSFGVNPVGFGVIPVSFGTQMKKVMLTVFKHNHGALQFFRDALQFEVDPSSPGASGCCGDDSGSYEILSRSTRFGEPQPGGGPCAACCH
ncbi:NAA40 acetyltransferase, partial [Calcarius ornatus]|nr:NAA40 acetyltransferase [Calcarius ornatus]